MKYQLPTFRDLNTYSTNGYVITNEEPELIREMLGRLNRKFTLGGGICSGGEMALMALLPICEKTILVDHGVNACAAAYYKSALLSVMGASLFRELIVNGKEFEMVLRGTKVLDRLQKEDKSFYNFPLAAFPKGVSDALAYLTFPTLTGMRKEYFYTPTSVLRQSRAKLDTMTIAHGDLSDLAEFGKFDLLYLSNAFGHNGRNGAPTLAKTIQPLMRTGGVVLTTALPAGVLPKNWSVVANATPLRTSWTYTVLQYNGEETPLRPALVTLT